MGWKKTYIANVKNETLKTDILQKYVTSPQISYHGFCAKMIKNLKLATQAQELW